LVPIRSQSAWRQLIAVILFAFATALVTAAGRLDYFGLSMAIAARYTTTMLFAATRLVERFKD
jgi:hypothetical protein